MLALAKIPFQRIGSLIMDNQGVISLTNRPLKVHHFETENQGVPTDISRGTTYISIETYLLDTIGLYDSCLRHQPNVAVSEEDHECQMGLVSIFREMLPLFVRKDLRSRPFALGLTDCHTGNIFVDEEWNIKYVIDLEWDCSQPIEMIGLPWWLCTDTSANEVTPESDDLIQEFFDIFGQEEALLFPETQGRRLFTDVVRQGLKSRSYFHFIALYTFSGLVFKNCIRPLFDSPYQYPDQAYAVFWGPGRKKLVASQLEREEEYDEKLKQRFKWALDMAQNPKANSGYKFTYI